MFKISRKAGVALAAAAALSATMAGQAQAASTTVRLHTQTGLYLNERSASPIAEMATLNKTDTAQRWVKTDTSLGFATLRNVKSGHCLTGRSASGFPVVTLEACTAANTRQQWRLGTAGDLRLRANGLHAEQKQLGFPDVRMGLSFKGARHQQWHIHPV